MKNEVPKYVVVENRIENAIRHQTFLDKLPGERVLAKKFQVSYMTLRRAIENLVAKGLLYKIPTQGTYVVGQQYLSEEKDHKPGKPGRTKLESSTDIPKHQALRNAELRSSDYQSASAQTDDKSVNELRQEIQELKRANQVLQNVACYYAGVQSVK